ncbi:MAG: glycosyltransferase family 39 protein, partial [Clostridiales bacterium]|nr:glycosyltransferase family 39 protein [Clostridiales bacterium]
MKSGLSLLLLNLLSAAFYIGVVIAAMKVICVIFGKGKTPGPVKIKRNETITITKEQYIKVILLTAGIWISIIGVSYLCTVYKKNSIISLSDFLNIFTTRWDSNSFREIAAKGYQIGTDRDVLMVFLPFYPLLIRAFSYIFGNVETSSIIISLFCAVGSVIYLYKLMRVDYDEETSFRAVKYYLLFPTAFFLLTPMSESIFMLLVLAAFYYIRRHKWSVASVIAFAASFTRLQGCLLMFPMIVEMFLELDEKGGGKVKDKLLGVLKKSYYIVL